MLACPKNLPIGALCATAMDGEDLRKLPMSMRKASLERLRHGRPDPERTHRPSRSMSQEGIQPPEPIGSNQHGRELTFSTRFRWRSHPYRQR
jgi:hypothetical protein